MSTSSTRFGASTVRDGASAANREALPGPYTGSNSSGDDIAIAFVVPSAAAFVDVGPSGDELLDDIGTLGRVAGLARGEVQDALVVLRVQRVRVRSASI